MTALVVDGPCSISGTVVVPGDKAVSHRGLMIAGIASGRSRITGLAPGADVTSTLTCLQAYGVAAERERSHVVVDGRGLRSWNDPRHRLDCANSGTTMRLLAGLAAHHEFESVLDGDASLRARPMERIASPLRELGASISTNDGRPPLTIRGGDLSGTSISSNVASGQVKSCVLFAGLGATGQTSFTEPQTSRDHTERLLAALGAPLMEERLVDGAHVVTIDGFQPPPFDVAVVGDFSSAAFVVAAAVLAGEVRINDVGLNATRIGFLGLLAQMSADLAWNVEAERLNEPFGSIDAARSKLRAISFDEAELPSVVDDELPLLAVLATQADGETTVRGAGELRVKESDRIAVLTEALRALGADIEPLPDGFVVDGPTPLTGTKVDPAGDHRIAMALAVAALVAEGQTVIDGFDCAAVSWPGFEQVLAELGANVELR